MTASISHAPLILLLLWASGGCMAAAVPKFHPSSTNDCGHQPITRERLERLAVGTTSKAEAEAVMGPPTFRLDGQRMLVWASVTRHEGGLWAGFVAITPFGGGADAGNLHFGRDSMRYLVLAFDEAGILVRKKLDSGDKGIDVKATDIDKVVR